MRNQLPLKTNLGLLAASLGALSLIGYCHSHSKLHELASNEKETASKLVVADPAAHVNQEVVLVARLSEESRSHSLFYSSLFGPAAVNSVFAGKNASLYTTTYRADGGEGASIKVVERYAAALFAPKIQSGRCEVIGTVKPIESGSGYYILVDRVPIVPLD